jgi:hypothetical protein
MLNSIVRDALLDRWMWRVPPVSFQTSQESTVPKAELAQLQLFARAGTFSSSQRSLLPEK